MNAVWGFYLSVCKYIYIGNAYDNPSIHADVGKPFGESYVFVCGDAAFYHVNVYSVICLGYVNNNYNCCFVGIVVIITYLFSLLL